MDYWSWPAYFWGTASGFWFVAFVLVTVLFFTRHFVASKQTTIPTNSSTDTPDTEQDSNTVEDTDDFDLWSKPIFEAPSHKDNFDDWHVYPTDDLFAHKITGGPYCLCVPKLEVPGSISPEGKINRIIIHHALDGRE